MEAQEFTAHIKNKFKTTSSSLCGFSLAIIDILTLLICLCAGFFIVNLFAKHDIDFRSFVNYGVFFPFIFMLFGFFGLYPGISMSPAEEMRKFSGATFISFMMILMIIISSFLFNQKNIGFFHYLISNSGMSQLIIAFTITFFLAAILLTANRELAKLFFSRFKWWGVPVVIYSDGENCKKIIENLKQHPNLGYHPAVVIDCSYKERKGGQQKYYDDVPVFSEKNKEIIKAIHKANIKTAFLYDYKADTTPIMTSYRYTIGISIRQTSFTTSQHIKDLSSLIGFASTHNLKFGINLFIKRMVDLFILLLMSPFLIPIFLVLSLGVKLTSKGPVFYGHTRVGKNGKEFKCWKFRSMKINSKEMLEEILATDPVRRAEWERDFKFQDDPRVTKFGKFLRKTSLDELPQLFNILCGQMSFVGPRPVTKEETELYGEYKDLVLSVTPGLSGMWQISGRSDTTYEQRIFFDTFYIQNWSVWLDFWIIIKTVWVVFLRKGAC